MRDGARPVTVDLDVAVPRRDGTRLRADVHRPAGGGAHPTLVMRLPYDKSIAQSYLYRPPSWYAAHGFAVVVEDVRGRFASDGTFAPLVFERADGEDLVRWVLDQPWCDGAVGMYGYSYCGFAQLLVASSEVGPAIRAIAPALAFSSLGEGCLRTAGATAAGFLLSWAAQLGGLRLDDAELAALPEAAQRPLPSFVDRVAPEHQEWAAAWLRDDPDEPYWTDLPAPDHSRISAAVLGIGGWYDTFRRSTFRHDAALRATGADPRLVVGPWSHLPRASAELGEPIRPLVRSWDVDAEQLRFFSAHLAGEGEPATGVRLAVLNSDDAWEAPSWPPVAACAAELWLRADGMLAPEEAADGVRMLRSDPARSVPARGGDDCGDPRVQGMGPAWQDAVEARDDVLVYTAPPTAEEVVLVGTAEVRAYVETEDPEVQLVARLAIVLAGGRSVNVVEGVVRSRASAGVTSLAVELGEFALRLGPGESLRLHLAATSSPRWASIPRPTTVRVLHGPDAPSRLALTLAA